MTNIELNIEPNFEPIIEPNIEPPLVEIPQFFLTLPQPIIDYLYSRWSFISNTLSCYESVITNFIFLLFSIIKLSNMQIKNVEKSQWPETIFQKTNEKNAN